MKQIKELTVLPKWRQSAYMYELKDTRMVSANPNGDKYRLTRLVIPKKVIATKEKYWFMAQNPAYIPIQSKVPTQRIMI